MYQSIATLDSPEFLNLTPLDINPLMSKCEIKVLYVGKNRNLSVISKDVATEMAKTLRGAPIVGYYKDENEDFRDHGHRVILEGGEIKFEKLTKPYGFVSPDADVWFQTFTEEDEFGNSVSREYLMTTGYLWTGQFPECEAVVKNGRAQSMELDEETLSGDWSDNNNSNLDFFIINDAIFSSLCILGEDVEPCFEGASITEPQVSKDFALDKTFANTLFSMMKDLKKAIAEGGLIMDDKQILAGSEDSESSTEEFAKVEDEKKKPEEDKAKEEQTPKVEEKPSKGETPEDEEKKQGKGKYELLLEEHESLKVENSSLQSKYDELQANFNLVKQENEKLLEFKHQIEDEKKDELINSFYMLSEEDKKDVIENKANYSLDDIKAKLSIICVDKKVSFEKEDEINKVDPISTFNLQASEEDSVPGFIKAMRNNRREKE